MPAMESSPKAKRARLGDTVPTKEAVLARDRTLVDVPGDGHCLYHCVGRLAGGPHTPDQLRRIVVESAHGALTELADDSIAAECAQEASLGIGQEVTGHYGHHVALLALAKSLAMDVDFEDLVHGAKDKFRYGQGAPHPARIVRLGEHFTYSPAQDA